MIQIALVEPQNPGNIGAIARVMKNFGFSKLFLVNPSCSIDQDCKNRAKHAQDVLTKAKIVNSIRDIESDYFIATTAKLGTDYNIPRSPISVEELAKKVMGSKKKFTILIGREDQGLYNEEIAQADFCVTIAANKKYPTLNISHSVAVILYELSKCDYKIEIEPISAVEKKQMFKMIKEVLIGMDFVTDKKRETQETVWKRVLGKALLTKRESFVLMGFFKKLK